MEAHRRWLLLERIGCALVADDTVRDISASILRNQRSLSALKLGLN
jgi:hypothetical protein